MKKFVGIFGFIILLLALHQGAGPVYAACNWPLNPTGGAYSLTASCTVDAASTEYYDYSSGTDDATNGYTITVGSYTVTINSGTGASNQTILGVGSFKLTGTGSIAVGGNYINVNTGSKCYVLDSDGDLYSPTPTTCSTTGGVGYIRKNKLAATTADCYDSNANAKPGQTTYYTTNRGDGSYDYNCDSTETKYYPTATYTCSSCTNGSGYASTVNTTSGFQTSVPACGASGTYYTVTNTTCRDPAVSACSGSYTTSTVTQSCR